jgi:hypothetical protein
MSHHNSGSQETSIASCIHADEMHGVSFTQRERGERENKMQVFPLLSRRPTYKWIDLNISDSFLFGEW